MFREQHHPGGFLTLHSTLIDGVGAAHGFTTAVGGLHIGEAAHLGPVLGAVRGRRVVMSRQVHGCAVTTPGARGDRADAHISHDPAELVAVRTADCVPVLLSSSDGRHVAAVHAGWRGLLFGEGGRLGVLDHACEVLRSEFGVALPKLVAAVGPCISSEHYEVGDEFRGLLLKAGHLSRLEVGGDGRCRIDLRGIARDVLVRLGLRDGGIDVAPHCTFADAGMFHSYRRQGQGCGHMAAFIGPAGR